jgi:hypothetical protein
VKRSSRLRGNLAMPTSNGIQRFAQARIMGLFCLHAQCPRKGQCQTRGSRMTGYLGLERTGVKLRLAVLARVILPLVGTARAWPDTVPLSMCNWFTLPLGNGLGN